MYVEAMSLLQGLQKCHLEGFRYIDIEVDTHILVHILRKNMDVPQGITYEIREIRKLLDQMDERIMHTFRENNKAADFLANQGG